MIYRLHEVENLTGLKRSTIYRGVKSGEFPAQVKLGARAVGWRSTDIEAWANSRPTAGYADAAGKGQSHA
jgi:prophage regulatory protein